MNIPAINRLKVAIQFLEQDREGVAMEHIDVARQMLIPESERTRPENDPKRSAQDRAAWAAARG